LRKQAADEHDERASPVPTVLKHEVAIRIPGGLHYVHRDVRYADEAQNCKDTQLNALRLLRESQCGHRCP
jgi:hypothetical protein